MKLDGPLRVCAYLFGVLPAAADTGRFRWPRLALKAFNAALFWLVSLVFGTTLIRNLQNYQKLTKKIIATRVLDVDELYVYMTFVSMAATTACQAHTLWPSVGRAFNDCFVDPRPLRDGVTGAWQFCTAFGVVVFVVYELSVYYVLTTYMSHMVTLPSAKLICLFSPLSNITCVVIEQLFYLMCVSLYLRLQALHGEIKTLVHKAKRPRWRYWVAGNGDGGPRPTAPLGVPAFGAAGIRDLRATHRACMELFARVNRLFQFPLFLCMLDSVFRIVIYMYGFAFELTVVIWEKKKHVNYTTAILLSCNCTIRIFRLWHLHMCEHYVTKKILPIRSSLSWLSLILNPVTSRRLISEIILFQHQLDTIKSKFEIFGVLHINMTLFYTGFCTTLAYIAFLLQFFAFNQISMANISSFLTNETDSTTNNNADKY